MTLDKLLNREYYAEIVYTKNKNTKGNGTKCHTFLLLVFTERSFARYSGQRIGTP